jgi:hypothetical protein
MEEVENHLIDAETAFAYTSGQTANMKLAIESLLLAVRTLARVVEDLATTPSVEVDTKVWQKKVEPKVEAANSN